MAELLIDEYGFWKQFGPIKPMGGFHTHFEIELNYVTKGSMKYFMGRSEVTVGAGRLFTFWGATPHKLVEVEKDSEAAIFTIPLHHFVRWKPPKQVMEALIEGGMLIETQSNTTGAKVSQWIQEYGSSHKHLREATMLEMQAAIWRSTTVVAPKKTSFDSSNDIESVVSMCRYIVTHLEGPLTSSEVAESVGHHPNYAMRIFKKVTGMTIQEYVVSQRVSTAQRLLLTTNELVESIGRLAGFQSTSQYYAIFRKQTGLSPLQYRKKYQV
jgi:AraC family transcriptional regulator, melibiose operon regulatory protein